MTRTTIRWAAVVLIAGLATPAGAHMMVPGLEGTNFALTAGTNYISTPEGNSILVWGLAPPGGLAQYPAPTLIVNEGATVTVSVTNTLSVPVSLVFPGQVNVVATQVTAPTSVGLLTREAQTGGTVRYQFVAARPGTYMYHSGTRPDLQIEMGIVGALIVRPADGTGTPTPMQAYDSADSAFNHEYLFLLTEMDPDVHVLVEQGRMNEIDLTTFFPVSWFINGRCAPDTMAEAFVPWLPAQPYNCMPMMHPGDKVLMRVIGAGRDPHPFHHHGNHSRVIARNGRLLSSNPTNGADLGMNVFTVQSMPGETADAIFTWTGENIGWDIYGHEQDIDSAPAGDFPGPNDVDHNKNGVFDSVPLQPNEFAADHGKPLPVVLPEKQDLAFGGMWSGSPFLGAMGNLPPGEGGMNPDAGFTYMWHSHTEKEMVNNDLFPGGMMTMLMIVPPWVEIGHTPMPMKSNVVQE